MIFFSSCSIFLLFSLIAATYGQATLTQCGQIVHADSGIIEYKLGERYDLWEACAFIVRVRNFSYIRFTLEEHDISGRDRKAITLMGFNEHNTTEALFLGPPNAELTAEVKGSVAVVIFKTFMGTGSGFRMSFQGVGNARENLPGFDLVFNDDKSSPLELPFSNNFTDVDSTNVMVLTANSHMISEYPEVFTLRLSGKMMVEPYCWDYFVVYTLDFESNILLESLICDMETAKTEFETGGVFIVFFRNYGGRFTKAVMDWGIEEYYDTE